MVKYIIFDFDGTLVDSKHLFLSIWNTLAPKYKIKQINSDYLESMSHLSMVEKAKMMKFPMYKIPILVPKIYRAYKDAIHEIELVDGIKNMLEDVQSKGYKTAIISSNSRENILQFLRDNEINCITDVICSSSIFGKDKLIKRFLKSKGLESSNVIYVGDEERDILACKKCQVKVIWVAWGYDSIEAIERSNPDYKAYNPRDILTIL